MPYSPSVILSNTPPSMRRNGTNTATQILGSKTGVEVGACYWKLHPTQPRFMVVFKHKKDRDHWYNNSTKLQEMKSHGVRVSTVWYSRDMDKVVSEEESRALISDGGGGAEKRKKGVNYLQILEERDRKLKVKSESVPSSVLNMSALSEGIEDLDKLNVSQSSCVQEGIVKPALSLSSIPNITNLPPPVTSNSKKVLGSSLQHVTKTPTTLTPIKKMSQDFSMPPAPLRLPLHVQSAPLNVHKPSQGSPIGLENRSNILKKLESFVLESLGSDKENKRSGEMEQISKDVAQSWHGHREQLEKIYETVLSEDSPDMSKLTQELAKANLREGERGITKEQVLSWTKEFLFRVGVRAGSDTEERFTKFLQLNNSQFKISIDEIKFIMQRNGIDINQMCKAFSENSTSLGFKKFVKISVNIDGNLLDAFTSVFLDFFKSKMEEHAAKTARRGQLLCSIKTEPKKGPKGTVRKDVSMDKVAKLLAKNEIKAIKNIVNDLNIESKTLAMKNSALEDEVGRLIEEKNNLATEAKLNKEDLHSKMVMANQENKALRSTNTSLQEELSRSRIEKIEANNRIEKILNFVSVVDGAVKEGSPDIEQLAGSQSDAEDNEVKKIQEAIRHLLVKNKDLKDRGEIIRNTRTVKFVTSEVTISNEVAKDLVFNTNKDVGINKDLLEKEVGKKVLGIKFRQGKGKGWRFLKVEEGLINPPAYGWSDREYLLVTQDDEEGNHGHLGQGCISTPGHSRRQNSNVREGPMFPPHLGGPRISTM